MGKLPRTIKFLFLLCILYVGGGITIWPEWHYVVMRLGGLPLLLNQATTEYMFRSTIGVVIIAFLTATYYSLDMRNVIPVNRVSRFLASTSYIGFIWVIIIIAGFRLLLVGIRYEGVTAEDWRRAMTRDTVIADTPVDFLFIDKGRTGLIYNQMAGELRLVDKTVRSRKSGELETEGSVPLIGKAKGTLSEETETTSTYKVIEESAIANECVHVINTLHAKENLQTIRSIELQSSELKKFDEAVALLSKKYKVLTNENETNRTRSRILEYEIQDNMVREFSVNSWVLISGVFSTSFDESSAELLFDYVPSLESRVTFVTRIDMEKFPDSELRTLATESKWKLSLFGKLVHHKTKGQNTQYTVDCYAIYR